MKITTTYHIVVQSFRSGDVNSTRNYSFATHDIRNTAFKKLRESIAGNCKNVEIKGGQIEYDFGHEDWSYSAFAEDRQLAVYESEEDYEVRLDSFIPTELSD